MILTSETFPNTTQVQRTKSRRAYQDNYSLDYPKFLNLKNWWLTRRAKFPTLLLGLGFLGFCGMLLTRYQPSEVQNWFWPGSYLVFLIAIFLTQVYLFSFLTLNQKLAIGLSLITTGIIWLKLHRFEW